MQLKQKLFGRGKIFHPTRNISPYFKQFNQIENKKIINIGSGGYRPIKNAINIDPYRQADIKAFGENLPFTDNSIDLAICVGVLEHVKKPLDIVNEIKRVLKPNGLIYIEVPFLQPFHAAPNDYYRWTENGILELCKDFKKIDCGVATSSGSSLAWIILEFFSSRISRALVKIILWPLKYIKKNNLKIASGIYFYGSKK